MNAEDEYWNDKRTFASPFDQPDAAAGQSLRGSSARNRSTSTFAAQSSAPPASAMAALQPRPSLPTTTLARTPKPAEGDDFENVLKCAKCDHRSEANLLTQFEGRLVFCSTLCWINTINDIAGELAAGNDDRLHLLKSLDSKTKLLDRTVELGISQAIVKAAVLLAQTCPGVYLRHLVNRREAMHHYVSFLKQLGEYEKAADVLDAGGNFEDAGMLRLLRISADARSEEVRNRLSNVADADRLMRLMVEQRLRLATAQAELAPTCAKFQGMAAAVERSQTQQQQQQPPPPPLPPGIPDWILCGIPVPASLAGSTLMGTLLYVILFEQGVGAGAAKLRAEFQMTDRHFAWVCVKALCLLQRWGGLEQVLVQKSLMRKEKSLIPADRVARYVHHNSDDSSDKLAFATIDRFLMLVSDVEQRFEMAMSLHHWNLALKAAVQLREPELMKRFNRIQKHGSDTWKMSMNYLGIPPNKWTKPG